MRFLTSGLFHESVSHKPLSIPLGPFKTFPKIHGDIHSSRCTTGIVDNTSGKWKKSSIRKFLNVFCGHLWVVEFTLRCKQSDIVPLFLTGVVDTGGKFATVINNASDTSGKFTAGVVDNGGKIATGIVDTGGKFATGVIDTCDLDWGISPEFLKNCK
jgi:hypothetical protein